MPRESLDALENLPKETPCQVAFGQLEDEALEESVLPLDQLALKNAKGSGVLFPKPL